MNTFQIWLVLLVLLPTTTIGLAVLHYYRTADQNCSSRNMYYLIGHYGLFTLHIITLQGDTSLSFKYHEALCMFQNLLSIHIGGYNLHSKTLKMRIVIGAWCLMCFFLVISYSSVLISFIMAPHYQPSINNVYELAEKKDINPVVVNGLGADTYISMVIMYNVYVY